MLKPIPAERAAAQAGTPLNQETLKIQIHLARLARTVSRELEVIDDLLARAGGLANVQSDLGALATDFDTAYDKLKEAVGCIDTDAVVPERTRDRSLEIAANKRAGVP